MLFVMSRLELVETWRMKGMCVGRTILVPKGACVTGQAAKTGVIICQLSWSLEIYHMISVWTEEINLVLLTCDRYSICYHLWKEQCDITEISLGVSLLSLLVMSTFYLSIKNRPVRPNA